MNNFTFAAFPEVCDVQNAADAALCINPLAVRDKCLCWRKNSVTRARYSGVVEEQGFGSGKDVACGMRTTRQVQGCANHLMNTLVRDEWPAVTRA